MRAYHHGNLRDALIACGAALIEQGGAESLTLRAVGQAAGVSRQAPYNHFADKNELLAAIATAAFARLAEMMKAEARKHRAPEERLIALGLIYVNVAREAPRLFAHCSATFVGDVSAYPDLHHAREDALSALRDAVQNYLGSRRPAREKAVATAAAWAIAHGLAHLMIENAQLGAGESGREQQGFIRKTLSTLARGIARN